jgi:hypothetical protein
LAWDEVEYPRTIESRRCWRSLSFAPSWPPRAFGPANWRRCSVSVARRLRASRSSPPTPESFGLSNPETTPIQFQPPPRRDLAEPVLASSGQSQNARLECHRVRARRSRNYLERRIDSPGPNPIWNDRAPPRPCEKAVFWDAVPERLGKRSTVCRRSEFVR